MIDLLPSFTFFREWSVIKNEGYLVGKDSLIENESQIIIAGQ